MRRTLSALAIATALGLATPGVGLAQGPTPNGHNCGGTVSYQSTHGGYDVPLGQIVSSQYAPNQTVDNSTQANCNQTQRKNP
jgi:hypothetical protein